MPSIDIVGNIQGEIYSSPTMRAGDRICNQQLDNDVVASSPESQDLCRKIVHQRLVIRGANIESRSTKTTLSGVNSSISLVSSLQPCVIRLVDLLHILSSCPNGGFTSSCLSSIILRSCPLRLLRMPRAPESCSRGELFLRELQKKEREILVAAPSVKASTAVLTEMKLTISSGAVSARTQRPLELNMPSQQWNR